MNPVNRKKISAMSLFLLAALLPAVAGAIKNIEHNDPVAPVIFGVTGILFVAIIGRHTARRLGLPSVMGELTMGIIVGNLAYYWGYDLIILLREGPAVFNAIGNVLQGDSLELACTSAMGNGVNEQVIAMLQGPHGNELLQVAHAVDVFSRYGIIFLLFMVGLDTSVEEMRSVGGDSARVAIIGVVTPFLLGSVSSHYLLPSLPFHSNLFLGATLAATSVGITAAVLKEMQLQKSRTAHVILGAAVFDDVLGLLMLAVVSGIVVSGSIEVWHILRVILLAVVFLAGAIFLGPTVLRFVIRLMHRMDLVEAKMFVSYLFVMVLAWMANLSGLATIIGAFTAGLILHDAYFDHWENDTDCPVCIKDLIMPLEVILVPIFFVLMGMQVKLETFFTGEVAWLSLGLLVSAVIGKLVSGWGASRGLNRFAIGAGMLPRGEVGLVFAAIGKSMNVIDDAMFSAIVLMVILTTLMSPPLLKYTLRKEPADPSQ